MAEQLNSPAFDPGRYWERRLAERYTLGSTGWMSLGEGFNRWGYAVRARAFRHFVRVALRGKDLRCSLDVGSGTGFYLELWRKVGASELTGSDLTTAAVARLRPRYPSAAIYQMDIGDECLPLTDQYDAISVMDVLFHLVDDERYLRALRNLAGLLKPDGVLIFTEIFVPERQEGQHQVSRTRQEIERMLSEAGLEIVAERPVFFLMNSPVGSRSRLLQRWWDLLCRLVRRHEAIGWLAGAIVFPLELALTRLLRDGPSTKILAAQRVQPSGLDRDSPAARREPSDRPGCGP